VSLGQEFAHYIRGSNMAEFDQLELIQDNDLQWDCESAACQRHVMGCTRGRNANEVLRVSG
jgi:hypothetical protein